LIIAQNWITMQLYAIIYVIIVKFTYVKCIYLYWCKLAEVSVDLNFRLKLKKEQTISIELTGMD
jgi:LEA14-like dessication related protein